MEDNPSEEKRKSSVELEMERYLEQELGKPGFDNRMTSEMGDSSQPLDLTVPKTDSAIPKICITADLAQTDTEINPQGPNHSASDISDLHATDVDLHVNSPDQQVAQDLKVNDEQVSNKDIQVSDVVQTVLYSLDLQVNKNNLNDPNVVAPTQHVVDTDAKMTKPDIQVAGKESQVVENIPHVAIKVKSDHKLSPPTKIPSRKNSQPLTMSDDLKRLENRLERYISKTGSEAGSETSEVSDVSGRSVTSMTNVVNRLHNGQTTSSRAKAADAMTASMRGKLPDSMTGSCRGKLPDSMTGSIRGKLPDSSSVSMKTKSDQSSSGCSSAGSSPPEKSGTASMLKSTLRKMSRFSISGNKSKKEDEKVSPEQKSRSRPTTTAKPSLLSPPGVGRSKSFKEPDRPGNVRPGTVNSRNLPYTSSLRRTKNKNQLPAAEADLPASNQIHLQRSGTGGHLERTGIRRSVSASRGAAAGGRIVKKSRTVQTQLTLDAGVDYEPSEPDGNIQFQVWLPDLLGEDTDQVQTHVETSNEPVDVRKNRQLTLENMKLQREIERMKAQTTENELLRKELKNVRIKLEEEQKSRMSVQRDLDKNHESVRNIMAGMESVEREWESKEEAIDKLQAELNRTQEVEVDLRDQLSTAGQSVHAQKKELDRSMAAQKTLIHQLQEAEAEARELQDFLQAEKNTLAEALRDSEVEVRRLKAVVSDKDDAVSRLEEQSSLLVRRAEQRSQELQAARAELTGMKDRAREMLLAQGAELSRASIAVSQLYDRLEQITPDMQTDERDDSESSDSRSEAIELEEVGKARRSSQFLVTPTENLDVLSEFSKAMMTASTGSDNIGDIGTSISSLATAIAERKLSEANAQNGAMIVPSLADQINQVSLMLSKLMPNTSNSLTNGSNGMINGSNNINNIRTSNSNLGSNNSLHSRPNGNTDTAFDVENIDLANMDITRQIIQEQNMVLAKLRLVASEREESLQEMRNKFSRNRQILTSNWQQAEEEVRKLDEIYHDTVNKVLDTLQSIPDVVETNPNLANLRLSLELAQQEELNAADGLNGNQRLNNKVASKPGLGPKPDILPKPNLKSKSESLLSRSLVGESLSTLPANDNLMSQSLLIERVAPLSLKTAGLSDPCLVKSPLGGIPTMLSSPRLQDDDLNANQSL